MKLNTFTRYKKARKRRGRGQASGLGKTSGRGHKGQKARSGKKLRPGFEGGQTPIFQRLPKYRGFRNPNKVEYQVVNVGQLNELKGGKITAEVLFTVNLIRSTSTPVKILGAGELKKACHIEVEKASKSALEKITAAGGTFTPSSSS